MIALLAALQAPPSTDIYVATLKDSGGRLVVGAPVNATHRPGYDNQPYFLADGRAFLYTAADSQADIWRYDLTTNTTTRLTATTPESEYSATPLPDGSGFSVVRVERDSTQRLWAFNWDGSNPRLVLAGVQPVGYHAWLDEHTVALFVLGNPPVLAIADTRTGAVTIPAHDIGRSLQHVPGKHAVSFVLKRSPTDWWITSYDADTHALTPLAQTMDSVDFHAWTPAGVLLAARGAKLYRWDAKGGWTAVADFSAAGLTNVTRLAVNPQGDRIAIVAMPKQ